MIRIEFKQLANREERLSELSKLASTYVNESENSINEALTDRVRTRFQYENILSV
jgi:hypothetical protein